MMDEETRRLATDLLEDCRQRKLSLSTAESCTGGLIGGALTAIPGSSDVVDRGYITYSNYAKHDLLGVPKDVLREHGAVSEPVARAMAEGAREKARAGIAIACTGIAGPTGGSAEKPVGLVHIAVAVKGKLTEHRRMTYGAIGRDEVRAATVRDALILARTALQES